MRFLTNAAAATTITMIVSALPAQDMQLVSEMRAPVGEYFSAPVFTGDSILAGTEGQIREYRIDGDGRIAWTGRHLDPPGDPKDYAGFGSSIALADGGLIAGSSSGQVVYYRAVGGWFEFDSILTSGSSTYSIVADVDDEWLVVCRTESSAIDFFRTAGDGWVLHSTVSASAANASLSGDEVLISRSDPSNAGILEFDGRNWILVEDFGGASTYGSSSALAGDLAAIADRDAPPNQGGAVLVYERDNARSEWIQVGSFGPQQPPTGNQEVGVSIISNGRIFCYQHGSCEAPADDRASVFILRRGEDSWAVEQNLIPPDNGLERYAGLINESHGALSDGSAIAAGFMESAGGCGTTGSGLFVVWSEWKDCNEDGIWDILQMLGGTHPDHDRNGILDCCEGTGPCPCPADLDDDGEVRAGDLGLLLSLWGTDGGRLPEADLDDNGTIDAADLGLMTASWGPCP